jgi:hypothetical protein
MQIADDVFWDELGVSWRASIPDAGLVSSRLRTRLRLQRVLIGAAMAAGAAVWVLGAGLAAWAIWIGWLNQTWNLVIRGATLAAVSFVALLATLSMRGGGGGAARSLREMLEVSITRTERLIRAADLGCVAVLVLAVGGAVGYAIRVRLYRPPQVSPVEALLALALVGLALLWFRWSQARALTRYRHLRQAFGTADEGRG